jgi:hypothetical protein
MGNGQSCKLDASYCDEIKTKFGIQFTKILTTQPLQRPNQRPKPLRTIIRYVKSTHPFTSSFFLKKNYLIWKFYNEGAPQYFHGFLSENLMLLRGAAHLNICSNCKTMFRKVRRTEISFVYGYGALHL